MKIVGSLITSQKIQPFIFDDESNELVLNQFSWDRAVQMNPFQEVELWDKIRQVSPLQIDEIRIGKYFCETCQKWFNADNQEWS